MASDKRVRFRARPWEASKSRGSVGENPLLCGHCSGAAGSRSCSSFFLLLLVSASSFTQDGYYDFSSLASGAAAAAFFDRSARAVR